MPDGSNVEIGEQNLNSELENYVLAAGELIKVGDFESAIKKFRDRDEANKFGLNIAKDSLTLIFRKTPQDEEINKYADRIASHSWFHNETKTIEMTNAVALPDTGAEIPEKLKQEIALIHMEEWLHGLQYLKGGNLTDEEDHEKDIAVYLAQKEIPLTSAFLNRYDRAEAVTRVV